MIAWLAAWLAALDRQAGASWHYTGCGFLAGALFIAALWVLT